MKWITQAIANWKHRRQPDAERSALRWAIGSFALPVLLFLLVPDAADKRIEVTISFVFASVVYIVTIQYNRYIALTYAQRSLNSIETSQSRLVEQVETIQGLTERLTTLLQFDPLMQSTGLFAIEDSMKKVRFPSKNDISITGKEVSFRSYVHFWQKITEAQAQNPDRFQYAFITHVSEVGAWHEENGFPLQQLKEIHRDFTGLGGKLFRVFMQSDRPSDLTNYLRVMREMEKVNINCVYINKEYSSNIFRTDFFLIFV